LPLIFSTVETDLRRGGAAMEQEELINEFSRQYTPEQTKLFEKAVAFAINAHASQLRESGEPYIAHPIEVSRMVMRMGMDADSVIAAILHDVVEDGDNITIDDIKREFGDDVATLVDGVTKLTKSGKQTYVTKKQEQSENLRKLFLATACTTCVHWRTATHTSACAKRKKRWKYTLRLRTALAWAR
jgi:GTP pyrophosphokinase